MKPVTLSRTIRAEVDFDSSHRLPDYDGRCQRLHGHTWKIVAEALFEADRADRLTGGILLDLALLKQALRAVVEPLDHEHLNDVLSDAFQPPTAEHIGLYIAGEMVRRLGELGVDPAPNQLRIEVWETPRTYASTTVAC